MPKIGTCEEYEIKEWVFKMGSFPLEQVLHLDLGEAYAHREAHLFKLENGQYALVVEEGCSCYSSDQAHIDLYPNKKAGKAAFDKWAKEKRDLGYR